MKKILILVASCFIALAAEAQIVSSSSNTYTVHVSGYRYFKAGLVSSSINESDNSLLGYHVAFGVLTPFSSIDNLLYGGEVGIGMRGTSHLLFHGLSVTPSVAYDIALNRQIVLQPHVGLFGSYDFLGFYGPSGDRERIESFEYYQPFDFGADLGIRFWFNHHFMLDVGYKHGLVESFVKSSSMKSRAILICAGINF